MHDNSARPLPDIDQIRRFSEVVLISDFLHPLDELTELLDNLARRGVRAHLVEVADPAEETFPIPVAPSFVTPKQEPHLLPVALKPMPKTIAASMSRAGIRWRIFVGALAGALPFIVQTALPHRHCRDCMMF